MQLLFNRFLGKLSQGFGGAILIPGFCSPKALKPLLPVFLSELEDLADGFAAVERVAIDARPCMANQVHHLRLAVCFFKRIKGIFVFEFRFAAVGMGYRFGFRY
ncbi:uncharacterized protein LOC110772095 isoform X2 [Prunus avium]|nr:uncharacterized protein LOC110772095 isoform X2 [Prunus avium]